MRLPKAFLQLPLQIDAEALADEVAGLGESHWLPHPQGFAGNWSLPLVALHGDPRREEAEGPMRPTPALLQLPGVQAAMAALDCTIGRSRLMRIDGNGEAQRHADIHYYWQNHYRVHVPIQTTPGVRFECGDEAIHMPAGCFFVFDTTMRHRVENPDPTRRIHLVIDVVGSEHFFGLLQAAHHPSAERPLNWALQPVALNQTIKPLRFESCNVPLVMSPAEQIHRIEQISQMLDASGAKQIEPLLKQLQPILAAWADVYAECGEQASAWPRYRALQVRMRELLSQASCSVTISEVRWNDWLLNTLVRPSLSSTALTLEVQVIANPVVLESTKAGSGLDHSPPFSNEHTQAIQEEILNRIEVISPVAMTSNAALSKSSTQNHAMTIEQPIFIISPPRSGSSLLFETLAQAKNVFTIGGESHRLIETLEGLHPASNGWESNRLTELQATSFIKKELPQRFYQALRDRDGKPAVGAVRMLEKTPKNALRIPFLKAVFPDAMFVYLYRDPRETLSSMLDAWRSNRFVTYPELPGWKQEWPWSLLLTPDWQRVKASELAQVVAQQWRTTVQTALDDLDALAPDRWCVVDYAQLIEDPDREMRRLSEHLGLEWDRQLPAQLPHSKHTLTSPQPEKWKKNAEELKTVIDSIQTAAQRARAAFARAPAIRPLPTVRPAIAKLSAPSQSNPSSNQAMDFRSSATNNFAGLLSQLGISLAVTTYQSGRLVLLRGDGEQLNTHLRGFQSPMGMALGKSGLALATLRHVHHFRNQAELCATLKPSNKHDACYLPQRSNLTGDIRIHEIAFDAQDELWMVNTRFSCLAKLDDNYSFVPVWRPTFVSALAAEDRCHLNGLAMDQGKPRFVTVLGKSDVAGGWREQKGTAGMLWEVAQQREVAVGLSMPHSPRVHQGRVYVLESGKGEFNRIDLNTGRSETIVQLPGFTRGLAFAGPYAFIGLSQVRESVFDGLPLKQRSEERVCGVYVVDVERATVAAFLKFEGTVQEVFDVQVLPHRYPELAELDSDILSNAFVLPEEALKEIAPMKSKIA